MRRAACTDANQPAIVKALEAIGATVWVIGQPVDLLVGYRGRNFVLEIKDGAKPPSKRKFTPAQVLFFASWRGSAHKVETVDEAIAVVTA